MRNHRLRARLGVALTALAVFLVVAGLLAVTSWASLPKADAHEEGTVDATAHDATGEKNGGLDVLFIGDSEAYSAFSPLEMWGENGFASRVIASHGQRLPYGYTLLREALDTSSPRVVVIETNSVYSSFSTLDPSLRFLQDHVPIFEYHDRWKRILTHDLAKSDNSRAYLRGFVVNTEVKPARNVNYMARTREVSVVPRENQEYLRLMVDYCRAHGATPVLVSTPSTVNWSTPRHNGIARLSRRMRVDYIDLNRGRHKVDIDWRWDTRDRGDHLNLSGATKVSRELSALLSRRYGLPDHRGDPTYATWEEDLDRYRAAVGA